MNTIAHMVVAAAALSQPENPKRNWAIMAGAFLPDASMFVFFAWSRVQGWSGDETWNVQYWTEPWQSLGALSNSAVLFALLLGLAVWRRRPLLVAFCAAALIHVGLDLPLHADDAHRHFWPLTNWRFISPISYWDPAHNGLWGSALETTALLAAVTVLWRRFYGMRTRIALLIAGALQTLSFLVWLSWA